MAGIRGLPGQHPDKAEVTVEYPLACRANSLRKATDPQLRLSSIYKRCDREKCNGDLPRKPFRQKILVKLSFQNKIKIRMGTEMRCSCDVEMCRKQQ